MIKVHTNGFNRQLPDRTTYSKTIITYYDPKNDDIPFVIHVPEDIKAKTGKEIIRSHSARQAWVDLHNLFDQYCENIAPATKLKIITYRINMKGSRYAYTGDGKIDHCIFRYDGSFGFDGGKAGIVVDHHVFYLVTHGRRHYLESLEGKFVRDWYESQQKWMNWTPEREAFFELLEEKMLDLIGMMHDFFENHNQDLPGEDVAKKIDGGLYPFPMIAAPPGDQP